VYLALAAGLAACTVVAGTFFLTRPSVGGTASAAPTAAGGTAHDGARTSPVPGSSASPSGAEDREKTKEEDGQEKAAASGAAADEASPGPRATGDEATPTAAPGNGEGGGSADDGGVPPAASPTKTATTPADPPWNSRCTYYSGTELTVRGDKGQRVVQVQCMLTQRGFQVGDAGVDGQFDGATRAAVKKFQRAKGLSADGKVGPDTWAALRSST
jgi:hypothetical protein